MPSLHLTASALFVATITISVLHGAIPSHWLSFALIGRQHRWPHRRTVLASGLAAAGHVAFTALLGLLIAGAGKAALGNAGIPPLAEHLGIAVALSVIGVWMIVHGVRSGGHHHDHDESDEAVRRRDKSGRLAFTTLALALTVSPCVDLLPLYLAAAGLPWRLLALLAAVMLLTTSAAMMFFVWLALRGLQSARLSWLDRYEGVAVGVVLILLAVVTFFV
ncbi:MAG: hypothetical protein KGJ62_13635 [Armatimonadetes bacterium]|nr:hypothetical protein [Armatimonadota bacterium]MDE2206219.1 hypothetical protein [Armatimonadota bacterium]